jgi:hypothetical protein
MPTNKYEEYSMQCESPIQSHKKIAHFILTLMLLGSLIGFSACTVSREKSQTSLPPSGELERYLETADHLTEKQKTRMASHRPFVGMTLTEANLAMQQISTDMILADTAMRAVYAGASGIRYHLYFQGDPPKVVDWTTVADDQIKLTDPDLLRPSPPGFPR